MVRIQVHEDLLYNKKLRRLMKYLDCSQCEAIGILGFLWLFAVHTADETGIIECIGPEDIYRPGEERPYTSEQVTAVSYTHLHHMKAQKYCGAYVFPRTKGRF